MAQFTPSPFAVLPLVAATVSGVLAWYAWRRRSKPGAVPFVGLLVAVAVWSSLNAVNLVVFHPGSFRVRSATRWFVSALIPVFGLAFALEYTGRDDLVSEWTMLGLSALPGVSALVLLLGDPGGAWFGTCSPVMTPGTSVVEVGGGCQRGGLFFTHTTYVYTLAAMAIGLILKMVYSAGAVYTRQAIALVGGAVAPFVLNLAWVFGAVPTTGLDPTAAGFAVMGVAWAYAVFYSGLLDVVPATSRIGQRTAIADLDDGVAVLDEDDRVISMNHAAGEMFGWNPDEAVGRPIGRVVGDDEFTVELGEVTTDLDADGGRRTFEVTVSPLSDFQDQRIGHTLVFRDVTERQQRKQQLEALNRVLRHNLRNDMNVVKGYADTLAERTTDPESGMAEFIAEQSSELVEVGSKVRDVERIMERRRSEYQRFDLGGLLRDVTDEVQADYPEGRVILQLPRDLWLRSDDLIVETVVRNLVHNALEHNDSDTPEVEVSATVPEDDGEWVDVVIRDNGPGIPEQERAALREGRETDLQHGSGLGLWVVNWGITTLGGDLEIENDGSGTLVRLRFPGLATPPDTGSTERLPPGIDLEIDVD